MPAAGSAVCLATLQHRAHSRSALDSLRFGARRERVKFWPAMEPRTLGVLRLDGALELWRSLWNRSLSVETAPANETVTRLSKESGSTANQSSVKPEHSKGLATTDSRTLSSIRKRTWVIPPFRLVAPETIVPAVRSWNPAVASGRMLRAPRIDRDTDPLRFDGRGNT